MANDWKKVAWKVGQSAIIVVLTGILAVYTDKLELLGLIPIVTGILNAVKHSDWYAAKVG